MNFTSVNFLFFALGLTVLHNLNRSTQFRRWLMLVANMMFIASFASEPLQIVPFAAFLGLSYVATIAMCWRPPRLVFGFAIAGLLFVFAVLKRYAFLDGHFLLPFPYLEVGLSYILFRVLQMMIDGYSGDIQRSMSPLAFLNFTCNFLCFVSGPIQRSNDFLASSADPARELDSQRVFAAFSRIISGYVKVAVFSAIAQFIFSHLTELLLTPGAGLPTLKFSAVYAFAAVAYTMYLYYNFSGYMDIVIGIGWLLGQNLPENFNKPFSAGSFLEFWSRWHMTLSDWFKTYVFNPLLKVLARRFTSPRTDAYLGVLAFFITFLIMGLWHGASSVFIVYGLLMGAGASANKLWQVVVTRQLGKKGYQVLARNTAFLYLSRGLTFAYFALALTCLWLDMQQLVGLVRQLGVFGIMTCYLGLTATAAMAFLIWDTLTAQLAPLRLHAISLSSGVVARNLALSVEILLIVTVASFFHKAPEFVYRAF